MRYKEFLLQEAKVWDADKMEAVEPESDTGSMRPQPSSHTTSRPHGEPPGRLLGDMRKHVHKKILKSEEGKRKYPVRSCHVCATHKKRSETRCIYKFCLVPLHKGECFQRFHTLNHY
jgi:hypothetical protein